jgi:DNA (cytosine-5)-methyltransferase 1
VTLITMADVFRAEGSNGLTAAVLFAGAGGSSLGLRLAGFRVMYANEWDDWAADTYELNSSGLWVDRRSIELVLGADLLEAAGGELDLIDGSPPCQDFSHAGRRNLGGENAARYYDAIRVIGEARPRAFVLENVAALLDEPSYTRHFLPIRDELRRHGYRVAGRVLDASRFGVPQRRERLIVIGLREDLGLRARDAFPRLGPQCVIGDVLPDVRRFVRLGRPVRDVRHYSHRAEDLTWLACEPAPTLTTGGFSVHGRSSLRAETEGGGWRRVTVDDAKALCSFPVDFRFPDGTSERRAWRMLGNCVPPLMAKAWTEGVARVLTFALSRHRTI